MACIRSLILLCVIPAIVLSGCKKTSFPNEKSYGDSLVILTYHAPAAIDPLTAVSGISAVLVDVVFDSLVKIGEGLEARDGLASSWQSLDNGLRWRFFLRKGVQFHDGVEFTAEDVKFTFEEIIRSPSISRYAGGLTNIQSIHIKDRYTVEIILNRPSLFFLYNIGVGILPAHILKGRGSREKFGLHPVGTGPFRFDQRKDHEIVFEANKDYFQGRPYLNRIAVKVYPNQELAWARLMRGEGDMFGPVDPAIYGFLRQVRSMRIYKTDRLFYSMIVFNHKNVLFHDRRVRKALNYAIDKDHIIQEVLMGNGQPAAGTIWLGSWAYNPAVKPYPYAPQKALSLLREAGWRDTDGDHILDKNGKGFAFTLVINEGDEIKTRAALYIQQQLWELGVLMNIKTLSTASMDTLFQGRFDAIFFDIFSDIYPDFNYTIWHSSQRGGGMNISSYKSDLVDKLLEEARRSKDIESAKPIYYRFQQETYDDPPGIFLYWADTIIGVHKRFQGVRFLFNRLLGYVNEWYVPEEEQKYQG